MKSNYLRPDGGKALAEGLKGNQAITELNIADNQLGFRGDMSGIIALADVIPDMRAMSSVDVLGNDIKVKQAQELINILQVKEKLNTLCGFSGDETELDLSNKGLSAGCAVLVANEVSDMGALTKLDISYNNIGQGEALQQITDLCNTKGSELGNRTSKGDGDY